MSDLSSGRRILRKRAVMELTGFSETTIRRRMKDDGFPAPIALGGKDNSLVGWWSDEVDFWLQRRPRAGQVQAA
jgi:predicted DNA-binding transcriptional regulator AlpA